MTCFFGFLFRILEKLLLPLLVEGLIFSTGDNSARLTKLFAASSSFEMQLLISLPIIGLLGALRSLCCSSFDFIIVVLFTNTQILKSTTVVQSEDDPDFFMFIIFICLLLNDWLATVSIIFSVRSNMVYLSVTRQLASRACRASFPAFYFG